MLDSLIGGSLAVFGNPPETSLNGMLPESNGLFLVIDAVCDAREPLGKICTTMGRRAGMLTQMMPRLHSMTDRLRIGTVLSVRNQCMDVEMVWLLTKYVQNSQGVQVCYADYTCNACTTAD